VYVQVCLCKHVQLVDTVCICVFSGLALVSAVTMCVCLSVYRCVCVNVSALVHEYTCVPVSSEIVATFWCAAQGKKKACSARKNCKLRTQVAKLQAARTSHASTHVYTQFQEKTRTQVHMFTRNFVVCSARSLLSAIFPATRCSYVC